MAALSLSGSRIGSDIRSRSKACAGRIGFWSWRCSRHSSHRYSARRFAARAWEFSTPAWNCRQTHPRRQSLFRSILARSPANERRNIRSQISVSRVRPILNAWLNRRRPRYQSRPDPQSPRHSRLRSRPPRGPSRRFPGARPCCASGFCSAAWPRLASPRRFWPGSGWCGGRPCLPIQR